MGIEALYRKPGTSKKHPGHEIYPYLLRNLPIHWANQVWALDATCIPMTKGFVYLTAVVDWASRRVLAARVACLEPGDPLSVAPGNLEILIGYEAGSKVPGYADGKVSLKRSRCGMICLRRES